MLHPVRIEGAGVAPRPLSLNLSEVVEGAVRVRYFAPSGEAWLLWSTVTAETLDQETFLPEDGWSGGVAEVDFTEQETVNRYGARVSGWKLPAFDGELTVWLRGHGRRTAELWRDWQLAWPLFGEMGTLQVVSDAGLNRQCRVRVKSFSEPGFFPRGHDAMETKVAWKCLDGYWTGPRETFTGTVDVVPAGELPPLVRMRWDGRATSARFPAGNTVLLGSTGVERWINLERGFMGQVTDSAGVVDTGVWSALRGAVTGVELTPHAKNHFELGDGLTLEVTPRYLSPWR